MGKSIGLAAERLVRAFEISVWLVGILLLALGIAFMSWGASVYFFSLRPHLIFEYRWLQICHDLTSGFLAFNMAFNYILCAKTHPGRPPKTDMDAEKLNDVRESLRMPQLDPRNGGKFSTFCKHCLNLKPPRCHHCHVCGCCVLKMDHHCPWLNNCVGFYNIRYFILFLLYTSISCAWAAIAVVYVYFHQSQRLAATEELNFILLFVLTSAVSIAAFIFLGWNLYLVLTGQTAVEFAYNRRLISDAHAAGKKFHNPYNMGLIRNWEDVMLRGRKQWWTAFAPLVIPPGEDGMTYASEEDVASKDV
eukprot:TRINITY_DN8795_c0_g1_i1.p1 TRINITY_DN8795_c0_g1~~TRINITY_DN8795_c0_g1_i1.p1  ORF type:complete len:305 (+),score=32.36 TRINITY_DN8795_c0_g1_i1:61-975(+)